MDRQEKTSGINIDTLHNCLFIRDLFLYTLLRAVYATLCYIKYELFGDSRINEGNELKTHKCRNEMHDQQPHGFHPLLSIAIIENRRYGLIL